MEKLVGARGFEPPTSCSQSRRATRLRHAPSPSSYQPATLLTESSGNLQATTDPVVVGKTDAQGRITVPVSKGQWRLHTIHMERIAGDADWESLWTTLTFAVS